jgi:hypothetical protein
MWPGQTERLERAHIEKLVSLNISYEDYKREMMDLEREITGWTSIKFNSSWAIKPPS